MTKNEFMQEAALRILARDPDSSMISIADYAAELADEVWKRLDNQQSEPEVLTKSPHNDTIEDFAKEILRLETEELNELRSKHPNVYYQRFGADVRFVRNCQSPHFGDVCINSVDELIAYGRRKFARRLGVGKKTLGFVDKALASLYNIKSW